VASTSGTTAPAGAPAEDRAQSSPARGGALRAFALRALTLREGSIIVVTVITIVYFAIAVNTTTFLSWDTFKNLLPYFAPFAILAAGEVFVMINGEIDLSIGGVLLISPFIFEKLVNDTGFGLVPALVVTMIVCMAIGAINGFFIAIVGISSFVVTLGMLFGLSGLTLVITHAAPVAMPGTATLHVPTFAQVFGGGTFSELFWALAIVILLQVALTFTRWGLYTVAVGSNRLGAAEAGINVQFNLIRNFVVCASCAGLVGILEAVRTTTATPDPSGANDFLFQGIAAAVIGGTLLTGGSGTVVGALIGALFLGVLHDGLIVQGVNADYLDLYLGIAILIAMSINVFVQRVRRGSIHG
jgi:simple sugar transport system permease protein